MIALVLTAVLATQTAPDVHLLTSESEGTIWCTLHADGVSAAAIAYALAEDLSLEFQVDESLAAQAATLVDVHLDRRPIDQVLEFTLGSVGLSHRLSSATETTRGTLRVLPAAEHLADATLLAEAAWARAISLYPRHPSTPHARFAQGDLAESRNELTLALGRYQDLTERHAGKDEAFQAQLRSGVILQRLGRWSEASILLRDLASNSAAATVQPATRLELARCMLQLGDPDDAVHVLAALETIYPASGALHSERLVVRAACENALGQSMEALRTLDEAEPNVPIRRRAEALRVRAVALQAIDLVGEAARAWVLAARESTGPDIATALDQAARLALADGDTLGVLFVAREADRAGYSAIVEPYATKARQLLDLESADAGEDFDAVLERAEGHLASGEYDSASDLVRPFLSRTDGPAAMTEDAIVRVAIVRAGCLDGQRGIDAALGFLRGVRTRLSALESRSKLDLAAASLLEERLLFDRALDAYRGSY